jgi:hypothetical protein
MTNRTNRACSRQTPYNDDYPTCERTLAELRIYGDQLDPDLITVCLGVRATSTQKKGETHTNSLGRTWTAKIGGWFLSSEHQVSSKDLRRHLDWLLAILLPRADELRSVQEMDGMIMSVNCIWWSRGGQGGPTLWPEQMRALADLDLECGFDIAFFGEDDAQDEQDT